MKLPSWLSRLLVRAADRIYSQIDRPLPALEHIERCKIISHRGEHDNRHVFENTMEAFERAQNCGVWGIELDVRWTKDLVPVVIHDDTTSRLFETGISIRQTRFSRLNETHPMIPTLENVIQRFGGKSHLMVELKEEPYPDPEYQSRVLRNLFARLQPSGGYHLISLSPQMFDFLEFVPREALLAIAETNIGQMSKLVIDKQYGGLLGHYTLMRKSILNKHWSIGHKVGTAYIDSKNCLFRELNRSVEWLFSNNACFMQALMTSLLKRFKDKKGEYP